MSRLLPKGETYVVAVPAAGGLVPGLAHRHRIIAVTDTRVHLFSARLWRIGDPRRLVASLPPGTVVTAKPVFHYMEVELAGERLWVMPAYHRWLEEAIEASRATVRRKTG